MTSVDFDVAGADDDGDVRRLLRENAMPGAVSVTLEREPNAFLAGSVEGERYDLIVARERRTRRVIGLASRAVYRGFYNGELRRIGYLGQLRLDRAWRGRAGLLPRGFQLVHSLRAGDELPLDLTSVVADNAVARRVLTSGAPGLPAYREVGPFVTAIVPLRRPRRTPPPPVAVRQATAEDLGAVAECLARNRQRYQFAPSWTRAELACPVRSRDLAPTDFFLATERRAVVGCLALWNQQRFKQIVVRAYSGRLRWQRPAANALARLAGAPRLPAPGRPLAHLYLSHVAIDDDRPEILDCLCAAALATARRRGASCVIAGFAAAHPFTHRLVRGYRPWTYRSVLYAVHWPGTDAGTSPDGRLPHHEVALL